MKAARPLEIGSKLVVKDDYQARARPKWYSGESWIRRRNSTP